jgi:hypothetical protein
VDRLEYEALFNARQLLSSAGDRGGGEDRMGGRTIAVGRGWSLGEDE